MILDKLYKVIKPTTQIIKDHPECSSYDRIFIKYNKLNCIKEYKKHIFFYNLLNGEHISKCLGCSNEYIIFEYIDNIKLEIVAVDDTTKKFSLTKCFNGIQKLKLILKAYKDARKTILLIHQHGYIHGDLYYRNLLITPNGNHVLIDFEEAQKTTCIKKRKRDLKEVNIIILVLSIIILIGSVLGFARKRTRTPTPCGTRS